MKQEAKQLYSDFAETLGRFRYPQPIVAKVIGAKEVDLTNWRSRKKPLLLGWDKMNRSIIYTGLGVIEAGLMQSFNEIFGLPARSAFIAKSLMLEYAERSLKDPENRKILKFLPYEDAKQPGKTAPQSWGEVGFSPIEISAEKFEVDVHHPNIIVPITDMIQIWAGRAMLEMEAAG